MRALTQTGLRPEPLAAARGDPVAPRRHRGGAHVRALTQTGLRPEPLAAARGDPVAPRRHRGGAHVRALTQTGLRPEPLGNKASPALVCSTVQIDPMRTARIVLATSLVCLLGAGLASPPTASSQTRGAGRSFGQPPRDTSALDPTIGSAALSGRVVTRDTGTAVKRAMVILATENTRDGRTTQTDDNGRYRFTDLQAGRYTVRVIKPGFTTVAYGQKHPHQPALPIQVDGGLQLRNVDIALPRGSVITGHVVDEDGEPMATAIVSVLRYAYRQGQRQIERVRNDSTDDRGQYRVFDLEPGDYFVSVVLPSRRVGSVGGPGGRGGRGGRGGGGGAVGPVVQSGASVEDPDALGFAPTYYPGVTMLRDATPLTVGLSQEVSGVNFAAQLVRMARVDGRVFGPDGAPAFRTQVLLTAAETTMGRVLRVPLSGRVGRDGYFEVHGVPPGSYTVQAVPGRGRRGGDQLYASQRIAIDGQDITDLTLMLRRGAEIRGRIRFDRNQPDWSDLERLRVTTSPLDPNRTPFGRRGAAGGGVEADGSFALSDIGGGRRLIRMNRLPDDLQLKAVYVDGRDMIDAPLEFYPGQTVSSVTLVLTEQITELTGMVHDDRGDALTAFTVIAFSTDEQLWQPQSRHIMASRPDQNGQYRLRGLPAGNYLLSAVELVEQGEWFDPRFLGNLRRQAARVTLREGESKSLNLGFDTPR